MRLHIKTTPNTELIYFNYQTKLVGTLHKWLGTNDLHGSPALYSFSWLKHAVASKEGLNFPQGSSFFISFHNEENLKQVVKAIMKDPAVFHGMIVTDIEIEDDPNLEDRTRFNNASPIFIRRSEGEKDIHYTFEDEGSASFMRETLLHKMRLAGMPEDETLKIRFDLSFLKKKTKIVNYRGVKNRVNQCPVIIEGKPETKLFAWNVGIGNSTGIGFGAIY